MPQTTPERLAGDLTPYVRESLENARGEILAGLAPGQRLALKLAWSPILAWVLPVAVRLGIECAVMLGRYSILGVLDWMLKGMGTPASGWDPVLATIRELAAMKPEDMHAATRKTFSNEQ